MTVAAGVTDDADARAAREAMVARLEGEGVLSDPGWARVLRAVPRHRFVPAFFQPVGDGSHRVLSHRGDRDAWLREAYADEPLVTQLDGCLSPEDAERADARPYGTATCSSSQPSLIARNWAHASTRPLMVPSSDRWASIRHEDRDLRLEYQGGLTGRRAVRHARLEA
jgi:hypothetical protein